MFSNLLSESHIMFTSITRNLLPSKGSSQFPNGTGTKLKKKTNTCNKKSTKPKGPSKVKKSKKKDVTSEIYFLILNNSSKPAIKTLTNSTFC
jgi:hypothetical protein